MSEFEEMLKKQTKAFRDAEQTPANKDERERIAIEKEMADRIAREQRVTKLTQEVIDLLIHSGVECIPIIPRPDSPVHNGWHVYSSVIKGFDNNGDAIEYKRHMGIDSLGKLITFRETRDILDTDTGDLVPAALEPEDYRPSIYSDILTEIEGANFQNGIISLIHGRGYLDIKPKGSTPRG